MNSFNPVTFPSADGQAELEAVWYLPTRQATNGAVIVLPGASNDKDKPPLPALCEGAAALGLTALRLSFRYSEGAASEDGSQELNDLLGAYNFLQSFGKEIKPKRYYIIGKSLGGQRALLATSQGGPLAGAIQGVVALGLPLHHRKYREFEDTNYLQNLTCPVLIVNGEYDQLGSPQELSLLLANLSVSVRLEIIEKAEHNFHYVPGKTETSLTTEEAAAGHAANLQRVVEITLAWLEEQDKTRENLRK